MELSYRIPCFLTGPHHSWVIVLVWLHLYSRRVSSAGFSVCDVAAWASLRTYDDRLSFAEEDLFESCRVS